MEVDQDTDPADRQGTHTNGLPDATLDSTSNSDDDGTNANGSSGGGGGGGRNNGRAAASSSANRDPTSESEAMETEQAAGGAASNNNGSAWQPPPPNYRPNFIEDYTHPSTRSTHDLRTSYQWTVQLKEPGFCAAPVTAFRHTPMGDCWDAMIVGMKVEVENQEPEPPLGSGASSSSAASEQNTPGGAAANGNNTTYWVASVLRISGYYALLRYEGFGQDGSKDFWIHLCSDKMHHVGWCTSKGRTLVPPRAIRLKYSDWKDFLVKRLTGARTVPLRYYAKIWDSVGTAFRTGMTLEVVDKMRICQVRTATIMSITGRRLYLKYDNVDVDYGFWCHEESPLIHSVGWAKRIGHQIVADAEYYQRCTSEEFLDTDCTPDMFPNYRQPPANFAVGMKIEAVDPLNLASVCVATVMKVLRFGYIMVRIDGYETDETGSDWFCYHASSPLIFPPGFCERKNIALKPPAGFEENFTWPNYLKQTNSQAAPVGLFCAKEDVKHGFKVGMKIEAADQMDPRLICVSTISRVVGHLLKVHFDGWENDYDQWMSADSVDIYPVGWGALIGHRLEGPRQIPPVKKEERKPAGRRGGKKRASAGSNGNSHNSNGGGATPVSTAKKARKSPLAAQQATPPPPPPTASTAASVAEEEEEDDTGEDGVTPTSTPTPSRTPPPPVLEPQTTPANAGTFSPGPVPTASSSLPSSSSLPRTSTVSATSATTTSAAAPATTTATSASGDGAPSSGAVVGVTPPMKHIPRLVDSAGQAPRSSASSSANLDPESWSVDDMNTFLHMNECSSLADQFTQAGVTGSRFLALKKEGILQLVNNKIGPCLKVENLLSLLKAKINPAHARMLANSGRKIGTP